MDPDLLTGRRKELTHLDVAFLRDIGYANAVAIPKPGLFVFLTLLGLGVFARRRLQKAPVA